MSVAVWLGAVTEEVICGCGGFRFSVRIIYGAAVLVVGKWGFWDIDLGNFRELGQDFLYLF